MFDGLCLSNKRETAKPSETCIVDLFFCSCLKLSSFA